MDMDLQSMTEPICMSTVSYTHLDVYKRQDLFWLENLNLRGGFKKTIMDYIAGKYPDPVSYTHLDVYKRQVTRRG